MDDWPTREQDLASIRRLQEQRKLLEREYEQQKKQFRLSIILLILVVINFLLVIRTQFI